LSRAEDEFSIDDYVKINNEKSFYARKWKLLLEFLISRRRRSKTGDSTNLPEDH
jgi:hypothetical protein